jgi:hypothetical protein
MLQLEGAQALLILLSKGKFLKHFYLLLNLFLWIYFNTILEENIPAVANEIQQVITVLTELSPSEPSFNALSTILCQIIEFVSSKGYPPFPISSLPSSSSPPSFLLSCPSSHICYPESVDPAVTTRYNEWKAKHKQ